MDVSVIIPYFNRPASIVSYTIESVRRASSELTVEILIIDDGSTVHAAEALGSLIGNARVIRTVNRGLLFARLTGLASAVGTYILFLDSDDLVSEDKLAAQVRAMERDRLDISYTDAAKALLIGSLDDLKFIDEAPYPSVTSPADFCFLVQPCPHSPMFGRSFLVDAVQTARFPPQPQYNIVAELWFHHVCACLPARVAKVNGPRAIGGMHDSARLTNHWEYLGLGALAVMEDFLGSLAKMRDSGRLKQLLAEVAFQSWRRLPRDFHPEFAERLLSLASATNNLITLNTGGPVFRFLSGILGPHRAAGLLKILRGHSYDSCRTISDAEWAGAFTAFRDRQVVHRVSPGI